MKFEFGAQQILGTRSDQQDSAVILNKGSTYLAAVCDGMGGLAGGAAASSTVVDVIKKSFSAAFNTKTDAPDFLYNLAVSSDAAVYSLADSNGNRIKAGSTIVCTVIDDNNLYWLSVGDSRIYILRNGEFLKAVKEHNYKNLLDEMLSEKQITPEQYNAELPKGEMLTAYVGIGNTERVELNRTAFSLFPDDIVLLTSDGLYKTVPEGDIMNILNAGGNAKEISLALLQRLQTLVGKTQDNATFIVIKATEGNV